MKTNTRELRHLLAHLRAKEAKGRLGAGTVKAASSAYRKLTRARNRVEREKAANALAKALLRNVGDESE